MPDYYSAAANETAYDMGADDFVAAYITAIYWSSTGDDDEELVGELSQQARESVREDCIAFRALAVMHLQAAANLGYTDESAGHDFWFTRNHHGVGFWDRKLLADGLGDALTTLCEEFPHIDAYVGDDGLVHLS